MQVPLHYEKTDTLNGIRCSICRSGPCKCADDVEDECTLCDNECSLHLRVLNPRR